MEDVAGMCTGLKARFTVENVLEELAHDVQAMGRREGA